MHGFQLTFFTQQDRMHGNQPLAQWLLSAVHTLGIRGATLNGALQGIGHDGMTHTVNLFDSADQPIQVTVVATSDEADRLFQHLAQEGVYIFHVKVAAEFGITGKPDAAATPINPVQ